MSSDKSRIADFLANIRPFTGAPRCDIEALASVCSISRFKSGEHVFLEGERATSGWVVMEGRVRILNFAAGLRTLQVEKLGPGEMFGLYCRLGGRAVHLCTAVADGELAAVSVPDRAFEFLRKRDLSVARCAVECCAERMRVIKRMIGFGRESVRVRVVETLLSLHQQFGDEIPATRHALSVWVGAAQETVFRVLAKLRAEGLLSTSRGKVRILNVKGLAKLRA